jgi:hypothetical protein
MDLLLKIVGGITLSIIILVGGFIAFVWWKLRGIAKGLGESLPPPATVDLTLEPDPKWVNTDAVRRDLAALQACGYVQGAAYRVDGIAGVSLIALHHPGLGAHGCYYQHRLAGNWTDLCATLADGLELTVCNAPKGGEMDTRPDTEKTFLPGKTIAELHARLTERIAGQALKAYAPENFKQEFKETYAKDMAWRNGKDGLSEEEFLRVAANHGKALTDEQLKEAFKESKLQELRQRSVEALGAFEQATTLTVSQWKQYEGRMFILRESFHPVAFLEYLAETIPLEDDTMAKYVEALDGGISLTGLLGRIATDTGHEFVKIGELEQPRKIEIYGVKLAPEKPAGPA